MMCKAQERPQRRHRPVYLAPSVSQWHRQQRAEPDYSNSPDDGLGDLGIPLLLEVPYSSQLVVSPPSSAECSTRAVVREDERRELRRSAVKTCWGRFGEVGPQAQQGSPDRKKDQTRQPTPTPLVFTQKRSRGQSSAGDWHSLGPPHQTGRETITPLPSRTIRVPGRCGGGRSWGRKGIAGL